jgi:L-lactate dehydrogenase (cytochrome)
MMPIALGPFGVAGMSARRGGVQAARAASAAAIPCALSTVSVCSIEEVARGADGQLRSQLCVLKDHGYTRNNLERVGPPPGMKTLTALPLAISPRNQQLLPSSRRAR